MKLKEALGEIYKAAREKFQIESTPKLILREDDENAKGIFGKTAYYEPASQTVVPPENILFNILITNLFYIVTPIFKSPPALL